jgi:hypothetical protein
LYKIDEIFANAIVLRGKYVSFDNDTGLPVYPPKEVKAAIPLYNPGEQKVRITGFEQDSSEEEGAHQTEKTPLVEMDYYIPLGFMETQNPDDMEEGSRDVNEIVELEIHQSSTLERQAFDAWLKISNGYDEYALNNLSVRIIMTDKEGNDVTDKNYIIPAGTVGIETLDGSSSLGPYEDMVSNWQIIPGEGLGEKPLKGRPII